jgi:hypothetical protein
MAELTGLRAIKNTETDEVFNNIWVCPKCNTKRTLEAEHYTNCLKCGCPILLKDVSFRSQPLVFCGTTPQKTKSTKNE